jgi:hypothetical protein
MGEKHGRSVLLTKRLFHAFKVLFRKSTTWDRRLYFPSEGRRAADFITLKIYRPRPGLKTRTLGPVESTNTHKYPVDIKFYVLLI